MVHRNNVSSCNNNNLYGLISRQTGAASASLHQIMWKGIKERCNDPLWKGGVVTLMHLLWT
jgi:hypothetical protein